MTATLATSTTTPATAARRDTALHLGFTLLRIAMGIIFLAHGVQKIFVYGPEGVAGAFAQVGVPLPAISSVLVSWLELLGGAALILGLGTRLAGLGLTVVMLGALLLVHLKNGFFAPNGIEFVLALLAGAATLTLTGAGDFSLDRVLAARRAR